MTQLDLSLYFEYKLIIQSEHYYFLFHFAINHIALHLVRVRLDCRLIFKLLKQAILIERHFLTSFLVGGASYLLLKDIDLLRCPATVDAVTPNENQVFVGFTHMTKNPLLFLKPSLIIPLLRLYKYSSFPLLKHISYSKVITVLACSNIQIILHKVYILL